LIGQTKIVANGRKFPVMEIGSLQIFKLQIKTFKVLYQYKNIQDKNIQVSWIISYGLTKGGAAIQLIIFELFCYKLGAAIQLIIFELFCYKFDVVHL
jgi:hypothetical protein